MSKSLDPVAANLIWERHVKKENQRLHQNEVFIIGDPLKRE